jgi:GDP-L-fucose synthase
VGGILANASQPADFILDNLRIQVNLFDIAVASDVEPFLFLGSSCMCPRLAQQPINEDALLTGPPEETNESFVVAKLTGIAHLVLIRRQHYRPYICAMPTNVYGPGDNFDLQPADAVHRISPY